MNRARIGMMAGACAMIATAMGCGDSTQPATGSIEVQSMVVPTDVESIYVTVTGSEISGDAHTTLTQTGVTAWSGSLIVPPGNDYVVTAFAYDVGIPPELGGTDNMIYTGAMSGVVVLAGETADVTLTLVRYPAGGGPGLNTPPEITSVTSPGATAKDVGATLSATAFDPDAVLPLTFSWAATIIATSTAGPLGNLGTFTGIDDVGPPGAMTETLSYTPPEGFVGTVLIQVTVTDEHLASSTRAFHLVVSDSGLAVAVSFDVMPGLTMNGGVQHALLPGMSTKISYSLGSFAFPVTGHWTDGACHGTFNDPTPTLSPTGTIATVVYTASLTAPLLPTLCELRFTVSEPATPLAAEWSSASVWVEAGKTVFVSNLLIDGALLGGSLSVADDICNNEAFAAADTNGLPFLASYSAYLSNVDVDARDRIIDGPYMLVDGSQVITSKSDLFAWGLLHTINLDEFGDDVGDVSVYTGTNESGTFSGANCGNWSSNLIINLATVGVTVGLDATWSTFPGTQACNSARHIYCFQTGFAE